MTRVADTFHRITVLTLFTITIGGKIALVSSVSFYAHLTTYLLE
jgi:hypothetical protein